MDVPDQPLLQAQPGGESSADTVAAQAGRMRLLTRRQDSTRLRSNVTRGLQSLSQGSKLLLAFSVTSSLAQVVASIVILVLTAGQECDAPLQMFNIVYAVRVALTMPLFICQRVHRAAPTDEENVLDNPAGHCVDRLKNLVDFFATIWFLFGNYWLFASTTCVDTSPMLFYTTMAWIVLGYLALAVPLLLCGAMICCLPCVLLTMRAFQQAENRSAAESVIKSIPKSVFHTGDMEEEDAMCVICLSSYVDGENIKKLPCNHHFHDKCIDEWVVIKRTCPLCLRRLDNDRDHNHNGNSGNSSDDAADAV